MSEEQDLKEYLSLRENLKNKTHLELVNYIRNTIVSEGLIIFKAHGAFSEGFIPDIITNIDGTRNGWILIDVINNQESVLRDIAGLLVVKANVEKTGDKIIAILCPVSYNVETAKFMTAFLRQYPDVIIFHIEEFRPILQSIRKEGFSSFLCSYRKEVKENDKV